jgi:hypothetical protein
MVAAAAARGRPGAADRGACRPDPEPARGDGRARAVADPRRRLMGLGPGLAGAARRDRGGTGRRRPGRPAGHSRHACRSARGAAALSARRSMGGSHPRPDPVGVGARRRPHPGLARRAGRGPLRHRVAVGRSGAARPRPAARRSGRAGRVARDRGRGAAPCPRPPGAGRRRADTVASAQRARPRGRFAADRARHRSHRRRGGAGGRDHRFRDRRDRGRGPFRHAARTGQPGGAHPGRGRAIGRRSGAVGRFGTAPQGGALRGAHRAGAGRSAVAGLLSAPRAGARRRCGHGRPRRAAAVGARCADPARCGQPGPGGHHCAARLGRRRRHADPLCRSATGGGGRAAWRNRSAAAGRAARRRPVGRGRDELGRTAPAAPVPRRDAVCRAGRARGCDGHRTGSGPAGAPNWPNGPGPHWPTARPW